MIFGFENTKAKKNGAVKNPEYLIDGRLGDAKRLEDINGITNGAKAAKEQECKVVIYDYNKNYKPKYLNYKKTAHKIRNRKADFENGIFEDIYLVRGEKVLHIPANKGTDLEWRLLKCKTSSCKNATRGLYREGQLDFTRAYMPKLS